jgi:pimeloyl-ACP methyl ester carboxylesterase
LFKAQLRRILGRPDAVSEQELDLMWAGIERGGGRFRLPAISSYIEERTRFRDRWIGSLTRLDVPAHVLWGRRDPVAVPAIAEQLAAEIPRATLTWLDDLGHYPMLEDPARWARAARAFVDAPR